MPSCTKKPSQYSIIDGERVLKATNVRQIHPVYQRLAESLTQVDLLKYIKIYNDRLCASNYLSTDKKKEPITENSADGVVGVQLLIDTEHKTVQFYSLTSAEKGYGRKIVSAVTDGTPDTWNLVVTMDWSGGFWSKMIEDYPRIVIF